MVITVERLQYRNESKYDLLSGASWHCVLVSLIEFTWFMMHCVTDRCTLNWSIESFLNNEYFTASFQFTQQSIYRHA